MLKGIAASEGIGIGKIVTISQQKITYEQKPVIGVHKEIDRLHEAIDTFVRGPGREDGTVRERQGCQDHPWTHYHAE